MMNLKDFFIISIILTNVIIINVCASENESKKNLNADSSIRSYNILAPADFSQHGNSNFNNALTFLKSLEGSPMTTNPHLNQLKIGKSIVEFWPPDMDKKKFFTDMVGPPTWTKPSTDPVVYSVPAEIEIQTDLPPIDGLPEILPDIPIHNFEEIEVYEKKAQIPKRQKQRQYKPIVEDQVEILKIREPVKEVYKIENYENLDHPRFYQSTESYFNFDDGNNGFAITNPGPVRFPTTESDIIQSTHDYNSPSTAIPTRAGNKKRKLKKKAKTTQNNAHFFETTAAVVGHNTPPTDVTVSAISLENVHVQIVEGNGFTDNTASFQPIKYTNVIDTVSNLTEQSYGNDERTRYSTSSSEEVTENKSKSESESSERPSRGKTVNELKPWDFMFVQLSRAIEDRDLMKIKTLVNAISEKEKSRKVKKVNRGRVATTNPPFEEITRVAPLTTEIVTEPPVITTTTTEVPTTTEIIEKTTRRRYIAPRLRGLSYKKSSKNDENDFNENSKESLSTETQTFATRASTLPITLRVITTTTEPPTTTVVTEPTTIEPTIVTELVTSKVRTAQRLRYTTERITVPIETTSLRTRSRRGRIVTPRNKNLREMITTTSAPPTMNNSSTFRSIRSSSRVRRIKGFRRMTGLNRY